MPALSAFPACCGASVLTGFSTVDPLTAKAGFKLTPDGMHYEKDASGQNIPMTYKDQFLQSLERQQKNYPNLMYSCILTHDQLSANDYAWGKIIKEAGFEFVRRWTNSVHQNREFLYLFVLCTDQKGTCENDFTRPPIGWEKLPGPVQQEKAAPSVPEW